jgi:hypothetical protein
MDDGTLAYISPKIPLTRALLDELRNSGIPIENRIRFSGPCLGKGCAQWTGHRCGLVDTIVSAPVASFEAENQLPKCDIRSTCRWYMQHQRAACEQCTVVVHQPHVLTG